MSIDHFLLKNPPATPVKTFSTRTLGHLTHFSEVGVGTPVVVGQGAPELIWSFTSLPSKGDKVDSVGEDGTL